MIRNTLISLVFLSLPLGVSAATFTFAPAIGSYNTGATFTTSVFVSPAAGETISATKVSLSFPADKLELVSYTPASATNILAHIGTSHDNVAGTIIDNVAFNPGVTSSTKVATIVFKAKVAGQAQISVASDSKLLDSSNLDKSVSSPDASYTVTAPPTTPDVVVTTTSLPTPPLPSASNTQGSNTTPALNAGAGQGQQEASTGEQEATSTATSTDDTGTTTATSSDVTDESQVAAAASSGLFSGGWKTWSAILLLIIAGIFFFLFKKRRRN